MGTTLVSKAHFSGLGRVATTERHSLGDIIRKLAQDNAKLMLRSLGTSIAKFTDNSTGAAGASFADAVLPTSSFDASTSAVGAPQAGFNTAMSALQNAMAVVADRLNDARAPLGLPMITWAAGTIATAGTIPALTLSLTAAQGTSAVDYTTGLAAMVAAKNDVRLLQDMLNELLVAAGEQPLTNTMLVGTYQYSQAIAAVPSANASSGAASTSISNTVAGAFLTSLGASIATIAKLFNNLIGDTNTGTTDLTDNSTGTAATADVGLTLDALPAAAAGAATTSAPKAGFDTQIGVISNAIASIAADMNSLLQFYSLPLYTDNSGGTVSTTIAAISHALTAVDGSGASGTVAVDEVTGLGVMASVNNAISSLAVGINAVRAKEGLQPIKDPGVGAASTIIGAIGATAAGVSGAGNVTLLNTAVNTWLQNATNDISTLVARLNDVTGSTVIKPLQVAAKYENSGGTL